MLHDVKFRCRYGDFGHMFEQLLRTKDSGEIWDIFYPTDDQWPADGELESYRVGLHALDGSVLMRWSGICAGFTGSVPITAWPPCMQGIVVTGSASDSFSQKPWIARLRTELAAAAARGQRILGVCFGCQIMALALGGKAGDGVIISARWCCLGMQRSLQKWHQSQGASEVTPTAWRAGRAGVGLETGTRRVVFAAEPNQASSLRWWPALLQGGYLFVHEMHQDCVQELPEGATLLASSERTEVEAWSLGTHILCIQGDCMCLCHLLFPPLLGDSHAIRSFSVLSWVGPCRTTAWNTSRCT